MENKMVTMCGALTYQACIMEHVKQRLAEDFTNVKILVDRTSTYEDILTSNDSVPPALARYGSENELFKTIVFSFECEQENAYAVADESLDLIEAVFYDHPLF